jgi:hypothetical protein
VGRTVLLRRRSVGQSALLRSGRDCLYWVSFLRRLEIALIRGTPVGRNRRIAMATRRDRVAGRGSCCDPAPAGRVSPVPPVCAERSSSGTSA